MKFKTLQRKNSSILNIYDSRKQNKLIDIENLQKGISFAFGIPDSQIIYLNNIGFELYQKNASIDQKELTTNANLTQTYLSIKNNPLITQFSDSHIYQFLICDDANYDGKSPQELLSRNRTEFFKAYFSKVYGYINLTYSSYMYTPNSIEVQLFGFPQTLILQDKADNEKTAIDSYRQSLYTQFYQKYQKLLSQNWGKVNSPILFWVDKPQQVIGVFERDIKLWYNQTHKNYTFKFSCSIDSIVYSTLSKELSDQGIQVQQVKTSVNGYNKIVEQYYIDYCYQDKSHYVEFIVDASFSYEIDIVLGTVMDPWGDIDASEVFVFKIHRTFRDEQP